MTVQEAPPDRLTVDQAAHRMGKSKGATMWAIHRGRLPSSKVGNQWLVRPEDADAWAERCKIGRPVGTGKRKPGERRARSVRRASVPSGVLVAGAPQMAALEALTAADAPSLAGCKPIALTLPDGSAIATTSWGAVITEACRYWLAHRARPKLPLQPPFGRRIPVLSREQPPTGMTFHRIEHGAQSLYCCTNEPAREAVRRALWVLQQVKAQSLATPQLCYQRPTRQQIEPSEAA